MTDNAFVQFDAALIAAKGSEDAYAALDQLVQDTVGAKLFTIMTVDMPALLARRSYTSDPANYPASGTKEITMNRWFDHVHRKGETFVANTLAEIATVFPDAELIGRLGCGSVVNLPVIQNGQLVATMNILHAEHYYTPERAMFCKNCLVGPVERAVEIAASLGS